MSTYIISDNHFFHGNIVRYCGRPYDVKNNHYVENKVGIDCMNEDMLRMYDDLPKDCTIINLGDVFVNYKIREHPTNDNQISISTLEGMVHRMSCDGKRKLVLVLGNHDAINHKGNLIDSYLSLGFTEVYDQPLVIDGVVFSHEPVYTTSLNYHGHLHNTPLWNDYFLTTDDQRRWSYDKVLSPIIENAGLIDPSHYINCCLDYNHKFLKL